MRILTWKLFRKCMHAYEYIYFDVLKNSYYFRIGIINSKS